MTDHQESDAKVEELAQACLERIADGIEPEVEHVCRDHPELVERVRRLLARLQSLGLVEPTTADSSRPFGEFRLLRKLGEGGMGVVWLAEQPRLHRTVALKLLRPGMQLHPRLRERFRREVQALSKLDHPNICTVYEAGEFDGSPYLAMRYIEGETLQQLLDQRRLERGAQGSGTASSRELFDLLHMVERVARALHAAHTAGVVHRDVKPGNILIDRHGEPVLVDFGLAHDDDPAVSALTLTGEPLGTPTYMAPEQIAGGSPVDHRADVYSLGVVLYESATLRPPFHAPTRDSLYRSIVQDPVPDPRKHNRAVGRDLRAVLDKALAKEPRLRFASALELAEELGRLRRREPVRTRSIGPMLRTLRWCQRNRAATAVLAVVTVALLVCMWALERSVAAESGLRALALVAAAQQVASEDPELAFKLQCEALTLQDPEHADSLVLASVQQTMSRLHDFGVIRKEDHWLEWIQVSPDPDGRFVVVSGLQVRPTLHRGDDGSKLFEFPFEETWQRPAIAFSPDGRMIALGDDRGVLRLYGLDRGLPEAIGEFGARNGIRIARTAWSCDGNRLVLAYVDGLASVWTKEGEHLRDLAPVDERIGPGGRPWRAAAFLPDGRVVAAGAIWTPEFEPSVTLADGGAVAAGVSEVHCTATRVLAYGIQQPRAWLWDLGGVLVHASAAESRGWDQVIYCAIDPEGRRFGLCTPKGLEIRSTVDGSLVDLHRDERTWIWHFSWSRDGNQLAGCDALGTIRIWRDHEANPLQLTGHLGSVAWTAFAPAGDRLYSVSRQGEARIWRLDTPVGAQGHIRGEGMVDVARAGDRVLVATGLGEVLVCDVDGRILRRGAVDPDWCSIGVAPGGARVAISSIGGEIWTWDPDGLERPKLECSSDRAFGGCGFLADGRILTYTLFGGFAFVLEDGRLERLPRAPGAHEVTKMVVSEDGTRVLFGDRRGNWWLAHLRDGVLVPTPPRSAFVGQPIFGLAFSPDGSKVMACCASGEVALWDLASGRELYRAWDHRASAVTPGFSPDGRRFATPSFDGSVHVIDLDRPDVPLVLTAWDRSAFFEALWIDDHRLITAGSDGARWWSVDGRGVQSLVESVPPKELTAAERDRYRALLGR